VSDTHEQAPKLPYKKKIVLDFDPAVVGYSSSEERKELAGAKPKRKIKWGKLAATMGGAIVAIAALTFGIAILTLPGCLKRKAIEAAAKRGIALTVDEVQLGAGRFTLVNVAAKSSELPGVTAKAAEVEIEVGGFDAKSVVARRGEVTIDGPYDDVKDMFAKWRSAHQGTIPGEARGGPGVATRLVLDGTHLVWTKPFGEHVKVDLLELHAELGRKGNDDEVHVLSPHFLLTVDGRDVGPWRVTYDREGLEGRTRVAFDPQLPDGPSALFVVDGARIASVDVTILRTQMTNIGVAPELLGLNAGTQIEAQIHFVHPTPTRAEANAKVGLFGLKVGAVPQPLDAKLDLQASGDPTAGAEVKKGSLALGPLSGAVVGMLKVFDDGIRVDLGWKAGPMACAAFASVPPPPVPKGAPPGLGDLAHQLGQFAQATGIAKVTGEVRMEGTLSFDSRDFGQARATVTPAINCDLAIFGQKAP